MVKKLIALFTLLLLTIGGVWGQSLQASFLTIPSFNATSQTLNVCQGSTVLFVLSDQNITNMSPTTTVSWSFTGANISSSTLRTPFGVTFSSSGTAQLTLTDGATTSTFNITINASSVPTATPTLSVASPTAVTSSTNNDGITKFTYCPSPETGNFTFNFALSSSLACPSQIASNAISNVNLIVLGSSTNPTISGCPVSSITRQFQQGFYYLVFRVNFVNGCTYSKVYYLEIGNPSISINTAAAAACDPGAYSLSFNDQTPGVTYTIFWDFNNNPLLVSQYTYPNFPISPQTVDHNYSFAPCTGTPPVAPDRVIKVRADNSCPGETELTPATIHVNKKPEAGFTISTPITICQGTNVIFTDTSNSGVYIEPNNQCSPVHKREWFIDPTIVAPNNLNGTLGSYMLNSNGSSTIDITFNTPGTYEIGLIAYNNSCDPDTAWKTICVVPAVQANFNASATTGCAPIAVTTTNNSSLPGCPGTNMLYNWSVSNATATCGTPAWNYTNNTNSNSAQPQFSFTGPGIYTIRLVSSLNPSVAGAQCQNDTITQTITVKGPPIIDLPPPSPICQGQAFIPQATVNDCYTTSSTYAWTFNSGTPASSTVLNPGSVTYATSGNFTYSLSATNECGTDTENNTITVNQAAIVAASANSISCSGQAISLSGSVTGGATGGTWTSSAGGNFLPNPTTLNASFVPSPGATGSVTLTLTATGVVAPCPSVNDQVTISLDANPIVLAGNDTSICAGSTVLLQGSIGGAATSATWSSMGSGTFQSVSSLNTIYTPSAADIAAGSVSLILTTNDPAGPCDPAKDTLNVVIIPIPTLTVGSSNAVCSGVAFSIPLTPSITSPPASYAWALSGSLPTGVTTTTSGTIAAPNSQFTGTVQNLSAGPVTLQYLLTATVNGCNSTSTPVSVVINPLPQPLITPPGPITACNGTSVTLTTSVFSSYLWSTNATTQSISVNAAGNYTVTVTNSYGCSGTSAATVVNFSVPLTPTFNQVTPICYNGTFSLPTTSINGISGTWSPTINPLATTTYTFTPSSGQCANTAQMTVTVNPLPIPTVTANGPLTFCQGSSVVLTATGGGTYVWNLNGAVIPNATSSSLTATQAGNYTVTVTNANGCSATSSVQVLTVNPLPQPTITASGAVNLCQGQSITFSTGTFDSYLWSSGQTSSSITVSTAGTYSVNVTSGGCTGISNTIVVTVINDPVATIVGTTSVCENGAQPNITFTGSNSTAPYTFTYSINGGANQTITTSPTSSSVTLPVPTATTGTFTYTLSNVAVGACSSAVTAQAATITVSANIIPTFTQVGPYCNGASIPALPTTANNSIVGSWAPAINNTASTAAVTTNYTFTPTAGAGICATTATMAIVVNPNTIPLFTQLGPYCQGATPDVLPLTANNNIAGTWSPASISTAAAGSAVYTFTPSSSVPATCAVPTTMTIVVTTLPSAIISGTASVCENGAQPNITFTGSNSTAPYTFTYSINGGANQTITTSPTSSSVTLPVPTATTGTFTYTLSNVAVGACSSAVTAQAATITVSANIIPTFTQVGPYCNGASIPALPTTANNSIVGSWAPAINNTASTAAVTTNYTFTPTAGAGICATTATMAIVVNPNTIPLFTQLGPYCQGATPDVLPLTSNNNIAGTWSPASISTAAAGSAVYTFTPSSSVPATCAVTTTMTIVVTTLPSAIISGTASVCENGAQPNITFTGSNSTAPYTFTYSINGGANQTITTSPTSSSVTLPVPTATTGTFTYTLSNVAVGACSSAVTAQAATITVSANIIPTFTQVGPYCNGASIPALPTTANNSIVGSWAPAINNTASTAAVTTNYTFTPTAGAGICATTATMAIVVNPNTIPLFTQLGPYCQGATPDVLPLTSNNNIAGTWSPASISTAAAGSAVYTFTPSSSVPATCAVTTTMTIVVTTLPSAIISGTASVCENGAQPNITFTGSNSTAPYTFTYSINGGANQTITTSPTSSSVTLPVPTATTGTFTYTLSNVAVGACSSAVTAQAATITVSANIIPTFTQVGPYCNGASIPALPTTANNSIVGSWAPAINNTASTAAVTTNYTFTPTAGAGICATTATMAIVVNPNTIPLFTQLGPYCQGATPDVLPLTSNNNIAGTWSPATISTAAAGSAVYTFTPSSSVPATCAVPTTMTIVVTTLPSAIISGTTSVCENGAQPNITFTGSNSTAPYTFTYSINGGANQTITTSPTSSSVTLPVPTATTGTFTYTLSNVAVGACSSAVTAQAATITVSANIIPTFTQVGPYCNGASIPALPTTANNSIVGSWAPAINNTASTAAVTTNYTFTPTAGAGICATTATMAIVVNPNTIPLFTQLGPYCQGATPDVLPLTSNNNIAGTWSPATISTAAAGSAVYTFTPSSSVPATCAVPTTMTIVVTTLPSAIISGTASVCENGAQPNITFTGSNSTAPYTFTYSINGGANQTITTSPTSSSVTLPVPTATTGTFTYTLSNVAVGACSSAVTAQAATITVSANIIPTFTQVGPYCNGASIPALPTTSNNSIVGSWAPAINNTASTAAVTTNYTFTPTAGAGICATTATMAIVVNPNTIPLFTQLGPYCQGATPDVLPLTANNNIAGTWSPASIATTAAGSAVYTFTPSSSVPATCAVTTTMTIVVTTLPSAIISGTASVCENGAQPNITFTGSNSTAPYTFTYSINGGANQTITTSPTSSSVTLPVPTATTGTFTYTLSNVAVGACSSAVTAQAATITVSANIIPTFTQVGPYCNGESIPALPTTANNSIVGSWAPAINNTASTAAVTTNYTFTPTAGAGICATTATMAIVVNPNTIPLFTQLGPYCQGATPDVLPLTANNNIAGTWSPATISTAGIIGAVSSTTYTFTPNIQDANAPLCALPGTMTILVTPLPGATISGDTTLCQGSNLPVVVFTGSNSAGPYTFTYNINGGANQTITTPANSSVVTLPVPTSVPGAFTYNLTGVSVGGCTNAITAQNVTVNVIQTPTVSLAASSTLICPNEPVVLTATGSPATFNNIQGSYAWSNTTAVTSNIQTVNPATVGPNNYTVTYTLNNCTSQPATVTISVQTAPQITIQNSPNATICEGGCVTLSAVPSASTIIPSSYSWSTGETTQSIIVCPTDTTTYTVIGLSGTCQSPLASTVVNVMPDPAFSTALISDTSICVGGSFTFNVALTGGVGTPTYNWYLNNQPNNFSGVLIPNSNNAAYSTPTIIQPTAQYYYVEVTYPGLGCDQIVSPVAELTVVADPIVTLDPLFNQTLCEGGTATCIIPEIIGGVGTNTYLWIPTMSADSIFCPPSDQLGTLNYNLIVQQSGIGCGSLPSNTVSITVISDPTIQIVGTANVCEGAEVPLITAVQGGLGTIANYQWSQSYPNGNPYQDIVGANAFNYTTIILDDNIGIAVEMNQTVEGCNASDTFLISVFDDPQVSIIGDSMTCMGLDNNLQAVVSGGVPNSTNTFTWFSPGTELNPNPTTVQGAGLFNIFSGTIISDTSFFVTLDNSGFGCDNDTSGIFAIDAIEWAIANFEIDPEIPSQSILTPTFSFINSSQNATSYFWDLGECDPQLPMSELYTTPTLTYNPNSVDQMNYTYGCSPGYYSVTLYAYNQGMCPDTVTQIIRIRDEVIVYVPNAFTPGNLDNTNPTFYPVITGKIKPGTYRFSIFNRWGELIYETYEPTEQWDGRYYKTSIAQSGAISNDEFVQDGVYIWKLSFIAEETGDKIEKVGHVTKLKSDKNN